MNPAYISVIAALCGSVVGGITSLTASWLSGSVQARSQQVVADKTRRQKLYKSFIEEASRLYGDALVTERGNVANLVQVYAMVSRMRVLSTAAVVQSAEEVVQMIIDTYFMPNKTLQELRGVNIDHQAEPLRHFSEACRNELRQFGSVQ
jgi:hypothetical protein